MDGFSERFFEAEDALWSYRAAIEAHVRALRRVIQDADRLAPHEDDWEGWLGYVEQRRAKRCDCRG